MTVAVVATGGTIASTPTGGADASPDLTGEELVAAVPALAALAPIEVHEFSNVPSAHLTVGRMYDLVEFVRKIDADPAVEGIVVTQGTDVLEETAYFVDLCYDGETPVVFTGAMRTPAQPGPDGPANLLGSVRTALAARGTDLGVLVAFNDRVHAATDVRKMHSTNPDAFRSPEFGPLGSIDEERVTWVRRPFRDEESYRPSGERLPHDVHAVTATLDMPPAQVTAAESADALCLAATGAGHVPLSIVEPLSSLVDADVPLVVTTRCVEGRLARGTYGFRGSEATLQELGAYFGDLDLAKTRIKTIVALAADALDEAFDRPTPDAASE